MRACWRSSRGARAPRWRRSRRLAPWLADYREQHRRRRRYAQAMMRRHGVPEDVNTVLASAHGGAARPTARAATVTRPLADGDTLTMGGREFSVHHRPGHSPSDLVLPRAAAGLLIGGDHLLARISSNALVSRPLDGDDRRSATQAADRLRHLAERDAGDGRPIRCWPATVSPFTDHVDADRRPPARPRSAAHARSGRCCPNTR